MSKSSLLKNARNYAEYLRKKERGPVKAFFHITKNENVPAIEQQGLLTNHPNANINSAAYPFRKHGTDAGGVWVTTEPTAFPVYGTTIGGKNGNAAARADALSTIKIEVPLPELRKMKAVQDPYGKNILRKGDDPRAVEKFGTWAGIDVPTTVLLNDVKPQWLKNIGYVEEAPNMYDIATMPEINDLAGSWGIYPDNEDFKQLRSLGKGDLRDYSGYTGHRHGTGSYEKSPQRFVAEYIDKNRPITERLPKLPNGGYAYDTVTDPLQYPFQVTEENHGYLRELPITAADWTEMYRPYTKFGEAPKKVVFQPGAYSRGMGHLNRPTKADLQKRYFNWNTYLEQLNRGYGPDKAAYSAAPEYVLDWDNIVYTPEMGYTPKKVEFSGRKPSFNSGHISNAANYGNYLIDFEGNEMLAGDESLLKIKELLDMNGPKFYTDEMNLLSDGRPIKAIKDIEHPTRQETLRALMKLRYLKPLEN